MVEKRFAVMLLSCPATQERFTFMRFFITNLEAKKAHYQNLTLYINQKNRIGVFGNYEFQKSLPFDHDYEHVVKEFLIEFNKQESSRGFVWVFENRGTFSSSFLAFIHSIARVRRQPHTRDPEHH